jgi:ATP-dependent 26S proteasome regulatory subunit
LINILNMSDGLLGDVLNLKFICTFNAPLKDIDKALLRKGRLVARYEFKDLSTEKANAIIKEQKLNIPLQTKPITLAELFNYQKQNFEQAKIVIGF